MAQNKISEGGDLMLLYDLDDGSDVLITAVVLLITAEEFYSMILVVHHKLKNEKKNIGLFHKCRI